MQEKSNIISLPVGAFALPVPRRGSIDGQGGPGRATAEGQEIHRRVQKRRAKADPCYQAEVQVSRIFERGGFRFQVSGRIDGVFSHEVTVIEEIKSGFNLRDLKRRLQGDPFDHPYSLQLLSYGYFHFLETGESPRLTFHLVSSRNAQSDDLALPFEPALYEQWLDRRLDELVAEAEEGARRAALRRKMAVDFPFPFQGARPGQLELMREIERGMAEGSPMLIQAPTGLGKTVGVLHPVLREALARGQQVLYVTPKNSQHAVAEEAAQRFRESGAKLRSLSVTAKGKICLKEEPLCTPENCEYARDYYGKLAEHGIVKLLSRKRKLTARTFRKAAERYQVCPFELQIDAAKLCDLLICDYNYVFAPRSALGRAAALAVEEEGKPNLVIDEAHNLPARAMEYYSPAISSAALRAMREDLAAIPARFRREAEELLARALDTVASCGSGRQAQRIELPLERFVEQETRLRGFLSRYLESDLEIRQEDPVLRLCFYWSEFTQVLELAVKSEKQEFFATFQPGADGGTVKITCCDASAMLAQSYQGYQQVVAFSATLKPFDYYAKLSGLDLRRVRSAEFATPFPPQLRKLLIIPQISTKYADRSRNYGKIAQALQRIVALRRGNYLAFFPSFEFLERVAELFVAPEGFALVRQEKKMSAAKSLQILDGLRGGEMPTVLFAVQGGSFSEGIDYAGEMAVGAFVVGPPLPSFDLEREQLRSYYQRHYGKGFDYAYAIPAMAKAVQAAGRVIRSETDRGIMVLMDSRFLEEAYSSSMPADWFASHPSELVSGSILKDLEAFWQS